MREFRFILSFRNLVSSVVCRIFEIMALAFTVPADLLERVRMSFAAYSAKLGRDLKAQRAMFALSLWQHPGGSLICTT